MTTSHQIDRHDEVNPLRHAPQETAQRVSGADQEHAICDLCFPAADYYPNGHLVRPATAVCGYPFPENEPVTTYGRAPRPYCPPCLTAAKTRSLPCGHYVGI